MADYTYTPTEWVDNSEPDINADNLNKIETALASHGIGLNDLAAAVANKISTSQIVNNLVSTNPSTVLSGPMGKSLNDKVTQLNSDLTGKVSNDVAGTNRVGIGFGGDGRINLRVDDTNRPVVMNTSENFCILFVTMAINPNTSKRALQLTWYADGNIYNSFIDTDASDI